MFLHIGADVLISINEIIAIMDLDTTSTSKITREFLKSAEMKKQVTAVSNELPKSYVVCKSGDDITVFVSPISSATLLKRANKNDIGLN